MLLKSQNNMKIKNLNESRFYVYIYFDTRKHGKYVYGDYSFDFEPFYIGKGQDDRCDDHLKESSLKKNSPKNSKIKKIIKETGKDPIILTLKSNMLEKDALALEVKLVALIGRKNLKKGPLTNLTDAGEGVSGAICSPELKIKRSENAKGANNPNYGNPNNFKHSVETKNKMSESRKGEKNGNFGKKHSLETKNKMREAKKDYTPWNKGKKLEHLSGENSPTFGRHHSEEEKEKIRKANSKPVINPNGVIFESLKKAGEYYNVSHSLIGKMLKGINKNRFNLSYYVST